MNLDPFDPTYGLDDFLAAASKAPDIPQKVRRQLARASIGVTVDCGLDVSALDPDAHALLVIDSQNRQWVVIYHLTVRDAERVVTPLRMTILTKGQCEPTDPFRDRRPDRIN